MRRADAEGWARVLERLQAQALASEREAHSTL
jgi:hypothetical protein